MIRRLDHSHLETAEAIRTVFQKSYAVEAELLGAINFPPLQRKRSGFLESDTTFYGFYMDGLLAAVIEILPLKTVVHIQSLVVMPSYFRMGIASSLLSFVLVTYPAEMFTVETGVKNIPAITLYKNFDFIEIEEWDTDHGVRKVRFEKRASK